MGYVDYSMSERAAAAYRDGLLPASKLARRLGVSTAAVREFLVPREWHHTSKHFNETEFFLSPHADEDLTDTEADALIAKMREWDKERKATAKGANTYRARVKWLVWEGSRNYPRAVEHAADAQVTEKGNTFTIVLDDGYTFRKRRHTRGFEVARITEEG